MEKEEKRKRIVKKIMKSKEEEGEMEKDGKKVEIDLSSLTCYKGKSQIDRNISDPRQ